MQRLDEPEICLSTESSVGVDRLGVVGIKFTEDVEAVFGHHLLCTASVVIAESEPGLVCGV